MASVLTALALGCVGVYCGWQGYQLYVYQRSKPGRQAPGPKSERIDVVVPFRNEEGHLKACLTSLLLQEFPKRQFKICFVDDASTDDSVAVLRQGGADAGAVFGGEKGYAVTTTFEQGGVTIELLDLPTLLEGKPTKAHKKAAITTAVFRSTADIIVTTDADCQFHPAILTSLVGAFTEETRVVCGPVLTKRLPGSCNEFQYLDLAAYQFLTAVSIARGTPSLANGACFAFRRSAFLEVGGYEGVDYLPSGDDVLLLHKFVSRYPATAFTYLQDGPVTTTQPVSGWRALWEQRLRWAGKAGSYQSGYLKFSQFLTFFTCVSLLGLLPLSLHLRSVAPLLAWPAKGLIDYLCLRATLQRLNPDEPIKILSYLAIWLIYPFFLVAVGSAAVLGMQASWKGRPVVNR